MTRLLGELLPVDDGHLFPVVPGDHDVSEETAPHLLAFAALEIVTADLFQVTRHRVRVQRLPVRIVK